MSRLCILAFAAVALLGSSPSAPAGGAGTGACPPPAFFEVYAHVYAHGFDIEAVREGVFEHPYYPPVDISDFDWSTSPAGKLSWWIRVEELRFLLPLIASERAGDQALLRSYFDRWCALHAFGARPNPGAWNEPMTVARRGMVFVTWWFREAASVSPDTTLLALLDSEIASHAVFLRSHYDRDSNHGLEEAIGFHELTRVTGNVVDRTLALERLTTISEAAVSERGIQREHSPGYHFMMLKFLDRYRAYLAGLATTPVEVVDRLDVVRSRLRTGGYYLYDHDDRVLQMGDTDSLVVTADVRIDGRGFPAVLFDPDGGVAVYKGRDTDRRYVAVSITSARPPMPRHHHNDVLAVFFSHDGETLLGGSGAFEYTRSQYRRFFVGPAAHSRVFHEIETAQSRRLDIGERPWYREREEGAEFGIRLTDNHCSFRRAVVVAAGGEGIVVVDTLRGSRPESVVTEDPDPHIILWQIGPDVRSARLDGDTAGGGRSVYMVTTRGRQFRIRVAVDGSERWTARVVRGSTRPVQGWYSPQARVKRTRSVAIITVPHESGDVIVTTGIELVH